MSAGGAAYYGNGNGHAAPSLVPSRLIVSTINLPVAAHQGTGETEDIEIHTDELLDNINDVVDIFKSEAKPLPTRYVKDVALQALFQGGTEQAIRILHIGLERILDFRPRPDQEHYYEKWPLATLLASLSTSQSRTAPKVVIPDAKFQNVSAQRPKAHYLAEAHGLLFGRPNQPRLIETRNEKRPAVLLTRALLLSLSGVPADLDTSLKLYDTVLNLDGNANNAVALLGKASILLRKRMFMQALRTYQHALKVTIVLGQSKWRGPDPRIGIGLCLHSLGRTDDARTAWTRAVELAAQSPYPQSSGTSASLLLGISSLNIARSTSPLVPGSFGAYVNVTETEARDRAYESGIKATQVAFQASSRAVLTAAIILEPVLGEGGYVSAPDAFLKGLRSICDEHDILLIADEVQSGYGRTGTFWSIQHSGVRPDILIFAKGTANGFVLSGIASRKELMDREKPGTQGGAYSANAVSCSAAIAVLDVFEREKILDNVQASAQHRHATSGPTQAPAAPASRRASMSPAPPTTCATPACARRCRATRMAARTVAAIGAPGARPCRRVRPVGLMAIVAFRLGRRARTMTNALSSSLLCRCKVDRLCWAPITKERLSLHDEGGRKKRETKRWYWEAEDEKRRKNRFKSWAEPMKRKG